MRLADKVALVTGGASGIGAAIARLFGREGASVAIVDIDPVGGGALAQTIQAAGGRAEFVNADVSATDTPKRVVDAVIADFGRLDVLVNNAAILRVGDITETTLEDWDEIMAVNLRATALFCREAVSQMRRQGAGSIVNVASTAALVGEPRLAVYIASKGGIISLSRALAIDHAQDGIRVNCLCPGSTRTPLTDRLLAGTSEPEALMENLLKVLPMHRQGTPDEVANGALFLASDEAAYVTGSVVTIDGGFTLGRLLADK